MDRRPDTSVAGRMMAVSEQRNLDLVGWEFAVSTLLCATMLRLWWRNERSCVTVIDSGEPVLTKGVPSHLVDGTIGTPQPRAPLGTGGCEKKDDVSATGAIFKLRPPI